MLSSLMVKQSMECSIIAYADFRYLCEGEGGEEYGSDQAAGKYMRGGKYVVQDGDIIHFQFSEL